MKAADFSLPDQTGKIHSLVDYKGKWVVLYFYPKDDTPGCTTEACSFRDNLDEFRKKDVVVLGVSKDTSKSHQKFMDKYQLNFPLLSDPDHKVIESYGAWQLKKFMGREYMGIMRNTYLINPEGDIVKTYTGVSPKEHVQEILKDIDEIKH